MLNIKYKTLNTEFKYPFTTAHGIKTHQPALLIAIEYMGALGIGEAPAIHYYNVSVESMIEELLSKIEMLQKYSFTEPDRFWHFCHHLFPNNNFLVCALDMAYWNLYATVKGKKVHELLYVHETLDWSKPPLTDYTLGIDSPEVMIKKMKENPYPIYKIKMSNRNDIYTIEKLRANSTSIFRVDANASWTLDDAIFLIPELAKLHVELVEQPLAKDAWDDMKVLKQQSILPLIADEGCVTEHDVKKCVAGFHGINIKLTKCGGLTPAKRMIAEAEQVGLTIMMGCMNETEIGSLAIAQFLPKLDYVDMDGPLLLNGPELKSLRYTNGKVEILN
jgi:L-Ala-D/L-Glu epimerase